ncbi:MAG: DUF4129 domain-containing protein [Chitinophagaceae bacterium]|nr:DUF4129 domain-containing protein [Chitinophagaceae bacterium]MCW5927377.1 DUF4129 domain-containing protein [Chitinophagaceae bacterium]
MSKFLLHTFLIILLQLLFFYGKAQDETIDQPAIVDSTLPVDPIDEDISDDDYDYDDYYDKTLYFTGKEDSTALYDSTAVDWRNVPDSMAQKLKQDDAFWYVDKDLQKKKAVEKRKKQSWWQSILEALFNFLSNPAVRTVLFYGIILLFALAVIWFLVNNNMNVFGKTKGRITGKGNIVSEGGDILDSDLEGALINAEQERDYRLAVRLRYLILLRKLSENQWIQYRDDATNLEYLTQLYGKPCYQQFFAVTRHYEYVWYGEAEVSADIYGKLVAGFETLNQTISTH